MTNAAGRVSVDDTVQVEHMRCSAVRFYTSRNNCCLILGLLPSNLTGSPHS